MWRIVEMRDASNDETDTNRNDSDNATRQCIAIDTFMI